VNPSLDELQAELESLADIPWSRQHTNAAMAYIEALRQALEEANAKAERHGRDYNALRNVIETVGEERDAAQAEVTRLEKLAEDRLANCDSWIDKDAEHVREIVELRSLLTEIAAHPARLHGKTKTYTVCLGAGLWDHIREHAADASVLVPADVPRMRRRPILPFTSAAERGRWAAAQPEVPATSDG
jgi:hypothetical protein